MSDKEPFLIEIKGQTEFHLGNPLAAISVDIAIGYRTKITKEDKKESYVYASLKSANENGITIKDIIKSCTTAYKEEEIPEILNSAAFNRFAVSYGKGGVNASELIIEFDCTITINERAFDARIAINYNKTDGKTFFSFGGTLKTGDHSFGLEFAKIENAWYLYANYLKSGETDRKSVV